MPGTNADYTLSNKTLHMDASNGGSAVFQGNLAAGESAITFVGDLGSIRSEAMLKVEGDADLSGSIYSVVLTGTRSGLAVDDRIRLLDAAGAFAHEGLSGFWPTPLKVGSTVYYHLVEETTASQLNLLVQHGSTGAEARSLLEDAAAAVSLAIEGGDMAGAAASRLPRLR